MTLQEQIREDMVSAMKSRETDVVDILRVCAGEFGRVGKDLDDGQVIKILRKLSENAIEFNNLIEAEILKKYLPDMLGENQIKIIVAGIINNNNYSGMQDMGKVMGEIKKLPTSAQIDGKISSRITKEILLQ